MIVLAKVLPYLTWVPTTNRGDPLDPEVAMRVTLGGFNGLEGFSWEWCFKILSLNTGGGYYLLFLLFLLPLLIWFERIK